jgi:hypothetical protein
VAEGERAVLGSKGCGEGGLGECASCRSTSPAAGPRAILVSLVAVAQLVIQPQARMGLLTALRPVVDHHAESGLEAL